jgi:hypothetical protein
VTSLSNVASLIGSATLPAGTYTSAQVTVGDSITVVPRGGGTGSSLTISLSTPGASTSNGETTITFPFNATVSTNAQNQVVIDFNLANFEIVGGQIVPKVGQGSNSAFQGKQHTVVVDGTVANLVAGQSFTLTTTGGSSLTVDTTSSTSIYNSSDGSNATLANGNSVTVQGTIVPSTGVITATNVRVNQPQTTIRRVSVYGTVSNPTSTGFTATVVDSQGFQPTGGTVAVTTGTSTVFHLPLTNSATEMDVKTGDSVIVTGSFDITSQTITAQRVDIYPTSGG